MGSLFVDWFACFVRALALEMNPLLYLAFISFNFYFNDCLTKSTLNKRQTENNNQNCRQKNHFGFNWCQFSASMGRRVNRTKICFGVTLGDIIGNRPEDSEECIRGKDSFHIRSIIIKSYRSI